MRKVAILFSFSIAKYWESTQLSSQSASLYVHIMAFSRTYTKARALWYWYNTLPLLYHHFNPSFLNRYYNLL